MSPSTRASVNSKGYQLAAHPGPRSLTNHLSFIPKRQAAVVVPSAAARSFLAPEAGEAAGLKPLSCLSTTTLMGKGSFDERHPLAVGMLGMHGPRPTPTSPSPSCDPADRCPVPASDDPRPGRIDSFAPRAPG